MLAFAVSNGVGGLVRLPRPCPGPGQALVRIIRAGVCATDLHILSGYKTGFSGVLGHEFVGSVVECESRPDLIGRRVCGELNTPCGECSTCTHGQPDAKRNHCPQRTALGIVGHDGVFAEYAVIHAGNLHVVPDCVSDARAVFVEPLSAAFRIVEQGCVKSNDRICILGDGKLGYELAHP